MSKISSKEFLESMNRLSMVPTCPKCKRDCFLPAMGQTSETKEMNLIILWCSDHGHWVGDVKEASWSYRATEQ